MSIETREEKIKKSLEKEIYNDLNKLDYLDDDTFASTEKLANILDGYMTKVDDISIEDDYSLEILDEMEVNIEASDENILDEYNEKIHEFGLDTLNDILSIPDMTNELKKNHNVDEVFEEETVDDIVEEEIVDDIVEEEIVDEIVEEEIVDEIFEDEKIENILENIGQENFINYDELEKDMTIDDFVQEEVIVDNEVEKILDSIDDTMSSIDNKNIIQELEQMPSEKTEEIYSNAEITQTIKSPEIIEDFDEIEESLLENIVNKNKFTIVDYILFAAVIILIIIIIYIFLGGL